LERKNDFLVVHPAITRLEIVNMKCNANVKIPEKGGTALKGLNDTSVYQLIG
jgi:hypothetical protein